MSELPVGWEDAALEAANLDMSNDESPRFFAKIIAIRTANRLAALQAKHIAELKARLAQVEVDAGRYAEARKNPAGFNHLLSLMIKEQAEGKGDRAKALDVMMDRIIASRQNAIDAAKEQK